jgi:hypothetical protein
MWSTILFILSLIKKIMNLKTPINENYAGIFTTITTTVKLDNCDNVQHAIIFGNCIIVGKDTPVGTKGIYFPAETQLSQEFLHNNNLYRDNTLNKDINEKGYFELNGRIRCMKFRGHKSEGLFMPLSSILFAASVSDVATLKEGDTFDQINGINICQKYIPKITNTPGTSGGGKNKLVAKKTSRLIDGQFRFHGDTAMLGKNIHRVTPETLISITNKLHGTSFVVSNILVKRKLSWLEKLAKFLGIKVVESKYDTIFSSRKVIKNDDLNKNYNHYYGEDVWAEIAEHIRYLLPNGMTVYGEAVGFTRGGKPIQGGYDYGCNPIGDDITGKTFKIYVYRITLTTTEGQVFEFSAKQVQDWCNQFKGTLLPVPEYFYGLAGRLVDTYEVVKTGYSAKEKSLEKWQGDLLSHLLSAFNMEQDCELCHNKVPAEGIVVRIEGLEYDAYKLKAFRFRERESKQLDTGEVDIETQESQEEH